MRVAPVELPYVHITWPRVVQYINDALMVGSESEPLYNLHHVQGYVTSGEWLLLVAVDEQNEIHGAMTISFQTYPLHRVAFITTVGGKFILTKEMYEQLAAVLRFKGATMIQAYGRPSMVRLLKRHNLKAHNTLVEATL